MVLELYDRYHRKKADLSPNDSSQQEKEIQSDNVLTLSFTLYEHIAIDVNDYVDFMGERYWSLERYHPNEVNSQQWSYDLKLYGIESLIKRYLVLNKVDGDVEPVFTLTAPPAEHVRMIVDVINSEMGTSDWKVGTVEGTENVTIDYEGKFCHEGLEELAKKVGTEYWIEGTTVNLCRCEHGEEITMGYGDGLINISVDKADNAAFYTRLFPVGSSRNIDPERYGHSRLQLPNGQKYVDINAEQYGIIHHFEKDAFADIYPKRVGTVSSVRKETKTGEDGNPFDIYHFMDSALDFDPNSYMLAGRVLRVSFQEGSELAGLGSEEDGTYYFEVNYNSEVREFEIITIWPFDDGQQLPGGRLVPAVGDKYILWNLRMPDEYYPLAEQEYQNAVNEYNRQHALDVTKFTGQTDHVWVEEGNVTLAVGQRVRLESSKYFQSGYKSTRITRICRRVNLPSFMDIELCDALSTGTKDKLNNDISNVRSYAKSIGQSVTLPDIIKSGDNTQPTDNNLYSARRILNDFLSKNLPGYAKEIITFARGIIAKAKSYFKGIENDGDISNTGTISTKNIVVTGKATFMSVEIEEVKAAGGMIVESPGRFRIDRVDTGSIQRTALNKDTGNTDRVLRCYQLAKNERDRMVFNEIRPGDQLLCLTFNVDSDNTESATTNRYYWRRVLAVSSETELLAEEDGGSNPYHWVDVSLDDYDGSFQMVDGVLVTMSDGATVKADVPEAGDETVVLGHSWGDETDGDRQGAWVSSAYKGNDPQLANLAPYKAQYWGIDDYDLSSHLKTYFARGDNRVVGTMEMTADSTLGGERVTDTLRGLRNQINSVKSQTDKQMVIWLGEGVPTTDSDPACDWQDESTRALHEHDLYYNKSQATADGSGRAWSWEQVDGAWTWKEITDRDVLRSLEAAAQAQESADAAQESADEKCKTFVVAEPNVLPSPPYKTGDLWMNASYTWESGGVEYKYDNDLLRCVVAKGKDAQPAITDWAPAHKATSSELKTLDDKILARVTAEDFNRFRYESGLVITDSNGLLYSLSKDGEGHEVRGEISTYVRQETVGGKTYIKSGISLRADQIDFIGKTVINGKFVVDSDGNVTMDHFTATNAKITGELNAISGTVSGDLRVGQPDSIHYLITPADLTCTINEIQYTLGPGIRFYRGSEYIGGLSVVGTKDVSLHAGWDENVLIDQNGIKVSSPRLSGGYVGLRTIVNGLSTAFGFTYQDSEETVDFIFGLYGKKIYLRADKTWFRTYDEALSGGLYLENGYLKIK